eukprot:CAMPEP_0194524072 /NCGR_PEP_ID=MMETSP0253-20130528/59137_1 /TAXON_ID=2966 /ORGANISM="Noctiluca scintillans" /LENGTH=169 /DNA_ID=CAMNT_0039368663 /DNA_START=782 /DNA_END=1286 /DNA_ORIENTATION=-
MPHREAAKASPPHSPTLEMTQRLPRMGKQMAAALDRKRGQAAFVQPEHESRHDAAASTGFSMQLALATFLSTLTARSKLRFASAPGTPGPFGLEVLRETWREPFISRASQGRGREDSRQSRPPVRFPDTSLSPRGRVRRVCSPSSSRDVHRHLPVDSEALLVARSVSLG